MKLGAALAILYLVLVQPNHPQAMTWGALAVFPLELPVIVAALLALGSGRAATALRIALIAVVWVILLLKLADFATFMAFQRGFNLVVDYHLFARRMEAGGRQPLVRFWHGWHWGRGGVFGAGRSCVGAIGGPPAFWPRCACHGAARILALALAPVTAAVAVAEIGAARGAWSLPRGDRPTRRGLYRAGRAGTRRTGR